MSKSNKAFDIKTISRVTALLSISLLISLVMGCGGGGSQNNQVSYGSGLGGFGPAAKSTLVINFRNALSLSVNRVATDFDHVRLQLNQAEAVTNKVPVNLATTLGADPLISDSMQEELQRKQSAFKVRYNNLQSVKNKITQYRIIITAPDLLLPVIAVFPSTAEQGSVQVDSGPSRNIRVEGVGVDIDGIEKVLIAAQTIVSLEPSLTTQVGGPEAQIPVTFTQIDTIAPITAAFPVGTGVLEGPHRTSVDIILSNFEEAELSYKISEVGNEFSTLSAVTSGFISTVSTATINLSQEGVYLFQYFSTDASGNQEVLNEKQVTVNFNTNPPVTNIDYKGQPHKLFAGASIGMSIEMQDAETGTVTYIIDTSDAQTTRPLRNKEVEFVQIGTQGFIPTNPLVNVQFSSEIAGGSVELSSQTTVIELTDISIGGVIQTKFEGVANSVYSSGVTLLCDTDSTSIYVSEVCQNEGKLITLMTGPFTPGNAAEFACITVVGGQLTVVDNGVNGVCQSCNSFKTASGQNCP
ncbi:MAG: hypothetical protein VX619_10625 [bacterium]|nr:hypothetical protein [bacterium]